MDFEAPSDVILANMLSASLAAWEELTGWIESNYNMDILWGKGGKAGLYEKKYRCGGKALCYFYPRRGNFGFMVIFGKSEREKFEQSISDFSKPLVDIYEKSTTYHDGKWVMLEITDSSLLDDAKKMLLIKRKPNKK